MFLLLVALPLLSAGRAAAGAVIAESVAYGMITVDGTGGLAGKTVTVDLVSHPASDSIWAAIPVLRQGTGMVGADGRLHLQMVVDTVGVFDLVVDENSDGFYQPWTDTILTVQVLPSTVNGLVAQYVEPNRIALSWRALNGATLYAVEIDSTLRFAAPAVIATVGDTTFVDSVNVQPHNRMFYRVRAAE